MAPDDRAAGRFGHRQSAFEDAAQDLAAEPLEREGDEVQRRQRRPAHCIDVREGVGGGDPPEVERVIHDRREEVDRLHEREVRSQLEHGGVVAARGPDQQPRVARDREATQNRQQVGSRELASAPGSVRQGCKRDRSQLPPKAIAPAARSRAMSSNQDFMRLPVVS